MAGRDSYLTRINRALRDLGSSVSLEVSLSGGRMRLRASLPLSDGSWKQRRISTAFPYERWLQATKMQGLTTAGISGSEALWRTETWWTKQRKRGPSADVTWATAYAGPLKPLHPLLRNGQKICQQWSLARRGMVG